MSGDLPIPVEDAHGDDEVDIALVVSWITRRLPVEE
jgi:hypothetical protein